MMEQKKGMTPFRTEVGQFFTPLAQRSLGVLLWSHFNAGYKEFLYVFEHVIAGVYVRDHVSSQSDHSCLVAWCVGVKLSGSDGDESHSSWVQQRDSECIYTERIQSGLLCGIVCVGSTPWSLQQ